MKRTIKNFFALWGLIFVGLLVLGSGIYLFKLLLGWTVLTILGMALLISFIIAASIIDND